MPYCQRCGHRATYAIPAHDSRERLVCTDPSCAHIHYDNPKVVTGAVCVHDGRVLLCRRAIEPRKGYWTLPAGFMEIGESMAEGACRETFEEAEATAVKPRLYCVCDIPYLGQIHVMYLCRLVDGVFGVGSESLACGLFAQGVVDVEDISFRSVRLTLEHFWRDFEAYGMDFWRYPVHQMVIDDAIAPD